MRERRIGHEAVPGTNSAGGQSRPLSDEAAWEHLEALIAGSPHNLVAAGQRSAIREIHIPEALEVGQRLNVHAGERWLDLGTGGGLPGLVLARQHPDVRWTLLDSRRKKIAEVERFAAALGLTNVETVAGRAETAAHLASLRGAFAGVVSRAVAPLVVLIELARGFLSPGAVLAAVKGPRWVAELDEARNALAILSYAAARDAVPLPTPRPSWLVTIAAEGDPPPGYPRPPGVPKQRPLGSVRER